VPAPDTGNVDAIHRWLARPRALARWWTLAVTLILLTLALAGQLPHSHESRAFESPVQLALAIAAAVAAVAAFRWEGFGGAVLVIAGVGLGVLAGMQFPPVLAMLVMLAFVAPGAVFLYLWQLRRRRHHLVALLVVIALVLGLGGAASARVYAFYFGAAHPQSTLTAPPVDRVVWMWTGATTATGFTVTARLRPADAEIRLVAEPVGGGPAVTSAAIRSDSGLVTVRLDGLEPATAYDYVLEVDGHADDARGAGRVRTFPDGPASFTIAAASCARVGSNGTVFEAIAAIDPLLYINTGDLHYGDIVANDERAFASLYDLTVASPAQAALYRSTSLAYMWDDHDYGSNDSDATSSSRPAAVSAYERFVPHYPLPLLTDTGPISQAFTVGRVRVVLTDTRSQRTPKGAPDDDAKTMLGAAQVQWFADELAAVAADPTLALVVWVNSVPWIAAPQAGADHWGGYTTERGAIADIVAATDVPLVMVSGDTHMIAIDDGTHSGYARDGSPGFPVLQAAALDRPGSTKGGPYSEGAFPGSGQFGTITVTDDGGTEIGVELAGHDW
jgi:phosphodiesterase/alkaline phosphatase D-like protein